MAQRSMLNFFGPRPKRGSRKGSDIQPPPFSQPDHTLSAPEGKMRSGVRDKVVNTGCHHGPIDLEPAFLEPLTAKIEGDDKCGSPRVSARSRVPGFKRVLETEAPRMPHSLNVEEPDPEADVYKRRKLLEALGVDDLGSGNRQGALWALARAKFEWMQPDRIRDGKGRRPGQAGYDLRTVTVPPQVFSKLSASQQQYWRVKSQYMDTVLFFKVGTFYELYELDAEIGHKELGWKMTLSGVGHCRQVGISQSGIDESVHKLVGRGYKVGRMEQTETGAEARARPGPNKMVNRVLTKVLTPATMIDGQWRVDATHLLAIKEEVQEQRAGDSCSSAAQGAEAPEFGFAFVDAAACRFFVGSLVDDSSRAALGALLTQVSPQELLIEHGGISSDTRKLVRRFSTPGLLPMQVTEMQPGDDFMSPAKVVESIQKNNYFSGFPRDAATQDVDILGSGRSALKTLSSLRFASLAAGALGALISHLRRLKLDSDLLPHGELLPYELHARSLRLDGQTLANLELLENSQDGGRAGTLLGHLDTCISPGGKRLLRQWICQPLQSVASIEARLDALDEFLARTELGDALRSSLRKIPDLERLIGRMRIMADSAPIVGLIPKAAETAHQRRLRTFHQALRGLEEANDLLSRLQTTPEGQEGLAPRCALLARHAAAACDTEAREALDMLFQHILRPPGLKGGLYCIDAPEGQEALPGEDPLDHEARVLVHLVGVFNQHTHSWRAVVDAVSELDVLLALATASMSAQGAALCRPRFVARRGTGGIGQRGGGVLELEGLWHPCAMGRDGRAQVPNDVILGAAAAEEDDGEEGPRAMLLTGPNMGGKSTLLRATCLAVILAQMGCYVPAAKCVLSPVDTIFTRLGASDRIISGESTFKVECSEAASVLQGATRNSLVILDELGRGTSTFDGYAIAHAVLKYLTSTVGCRLLFATHYHPLTAEFAADPAVKLCHMACMFRPSPVAPPAPCRPAPEQPGSSAPSEDPCNSAAQHRDPPSPPLASPGAPGGHLRARTRGAPSSSTTPTPIPSLAAGGDASPPGHGATATGSRNAQRPEPPGGAADESVGFSTDGELVFLYRLLPGACPKSYGLQVATLAGIPRPVVAAASLAAEQLERTLEASFDAAAYGQELPELHRRWLRAVVGAVGRSGPEDADAFDMLLCIWTEIKMSAV